MEHIRHEIEPIHKHEKTDADARKIAITGAILFGFIVLGIVVTALLIFLFKKAPVEPERPPSEFISERVPVPEPRLQSAPWQDLRYMRAYEDSVLNGYGWVDQKAGIAHIPIGEAMDRIAKQGLPVRSPGVQVGAPPTGPESGGPQTGAPSQVNDTFGSTARGSTGNAERSSQKESQR